jgi:hypothetical protein
MAMKRPRIDSVHDADRLIAQVEASAGAAMAEIARLQVDVPPLRALSRLKFDRIGRDPLDADAPLNLIEQINQSFTYVASAKASRVLLALHPELAPLTLNLGTSSGFDIVSTTEGLLAAEVFAAVDPSNNGKLRNDIDRLENAKAAHRYVFFMCPGYDEGRVRRLERVEGIQVWSVGGLA